jgi:hypothetical protein
VNKRGLTLKAAAQTAEGFGGAINFVIVVEQTEIFLKCKGKGKAIPLQA